MRFSSLMASPRSLCRLSTFALLALLGSAAPALAATIYVDDLKDDLPGTGTFFDPYRKLQRAIDAAASGDTIFIRKGRHLAQPSAFVDPICGNCLEGQARPPIDVTQGFHIELKSLTLVGESRQGTILETRAGYGVNFDHAGRSVLKNLTITNGRRDNDEDATSAAVVVRWTDLLIHEVDIRDNTHRILGENELVAGIAGIAGREGAKITGENLRIYNNGWDGIALYRKHPDVPDSAPRAKLNNIDIDTGRGVGIGITWESQADITNARVSNYWKGVGTFGSSRMTLRNSIVRDQWTWGVTAGGTSHLTAINNVIAFQGRVGLGQWDPGATVNFQNNIVYGNGHSTANEYLGPRAGIWLTNPDGATVRYNDSFANTFYNTCVAGPGSDTTWGCNQEHSFPPDSGNIGNISADPLFVNAAGHDYRLRSGSPAIDTGAPEIQDPDSTRSDMGAYGGPGSWPGTTSIMPDLLPQSITGLPSIVEAGDVIHFSSAIRNDGWAPSGYFTTKWLLGTQSSYWGHAGVPAGATVSDGSTEFTWTATAGIHTVTFIVDADDYSTEGDESNNTISLTFVVHPRRADLAPTPITWDGEIVAKKTVLFDSGVRNLRDVPAGPFAIKWFVDGVQVGHGVHGGVPGNTTVLNDNSQYTWLATSGMHTITFIVDTGSQIPETYESNNTTFMWVFVP